MSPLFWIISYYPIFHFETCFLWSEIYFDPRITATPMEPTTNRGKNTTTNTMYPCLKNKSVINGPIKPTQMATPTAYFHHSIFGFSSLSLSAAIFSSGISFLLPSISLICTIEKNNCHECEKSNPKPQFTWYPLTSYY